MKHPNPDVPDMAIAWQTRQLADELGLTGKHVFFNDGWVPTTTGRTTCSTPTSA